MPEQTASSQPRDEKPFSLPFFVVIDHEQSVSDHPTLAEARAAGQRACDAEVLSCHFSIQDAEGEHVEDIARSDLASLHHRVGSFNDMLGNLRRGPCAEGAGHDNPGRSVVL